MEAKAFPVKKENALGLGKDFLLSYGVSKKLKNFQAKDSYVWLYNRRELNPLNWSTLPLSFRKEIISDFDFSLPKIKKESQSADGTAKLLLELSDGNFIECVYIPQGKRTTLCISSQAGCPLKCKFCLTGKGGFFRNLETFEIIAQIIILENRFSLFGKTYNIVVMGMGEPLLNFSNFKKAMSIATDCEGLAISRRRITVSTIGIKERVEEYLKDSSMPLLAISLHSAIQEKRDKIIPSKSALPLKDLRALLQSNSRRNREPVSIEYVVLKNFNDSKEDIDALIKFCKGLKAKVNLIQFNEHPLLDFQAVEYEEMVKIQDFLSENRISTTIRKSRGKDICAAC
ncbi:MAG: 23S rRNA (adenine(2503)-C(2))-methyltransferase RlmN, partial [Acidobacteria bacterium]|nr:23S rRNA (adenine(2503)-C(2))-methyltransferase RlmN [Acidobacteriota bacterium]